jgi:NAD/NADP transhydrogenase beta subunit
MSLFREILEELAYIGRALKDRDNQILLMVVFVVLSVLVMMIFGVAHYDNFFKWLVPNQCRELSNVQIIAFLYLGAAFFVIAATFVGSVVAFLKERDIALRGNHERSEEPTKQMMLLGALFGIVSMVILGSTLAWC